MIPASWAQQGASEDYFALGRQIAEQAALVDALASGYDRVDHQLLEPLLGLARVQTRANRFDDADVSLDHAIQVVRVRDGLFAPSQYSVLEQSVENNVQRGAWDALTGELDHLQWLFTSQYQGEVSEQLERLMWLSDKYLQGVFHDREERQVQHLKQATRVNRLALDLVRQHDQVNLVSRIAVGYALVRKYHLEAQGIRGGGETSFEIRSQLPESNLVESRKRALSKRYRSGLAVLQDLAGMVEQARPDDVEAQALMELVVADWQLLFNQPGGAEDYTRIYERLAQVGVDPHRLQAFFARPVVLPEPTLSLSLDQALAAREAIVSDKLVVFERSANFPGVFLTSTTDVGQLAVRGAFVTSEIEATLDPVAASTAWLGGTLRTNRGIPTDLELHSSPEDPRATRQVRRQLHELHLRPALADGRLQPGRIAIQYSFRRNRVVDELSIWDALQVGQR
jgi:hypothetical protein